MLEHDLDRQSSLHVWYRSVGRSSPKQGSLGLLIREAIELPMQGAYKVAIETSDGTWLEFDAIEAVAAEMKTSDADALDIDAQL